MWRHAAMMLCWMGSAWAGSTEPIYYLDGEVEGPFTHRFIQVTKTLRGRPTDVTFHYVEAGDKQNPPVVFLHGAPDSWYLWHRQLAALKEAYYVIAFDLKGFGQSSKPYSSLIYPERQDPGGDYSREMVGDELVTALDQMGIQRFHLVTFDWGSWIGAILAGRWKERIIRYVKMQSTVAVHDIKHVAQFRFFKQFPKWAIEHIEAHREHLIRSGLSTVENPLTFRRTLKDLPEEEIIRIIQAFSYPGCARGWVSYMCALPEGYQVLESQLAAFATYSFPTLLLQATDDPAQPVYYFDGTHRTVCKTMIYPWGPFPWGTRCVTEPGGGKPAVVYFPDAVLEWVEGTGHFTPYEAPDQVTKKIRRFLDAESVEALQEGLSDPYKRAKR